MQHVRLWLRHTIVGHSQAAMAKGHSQVAMAKGG